MTERKKQSVKNRKTLWIHNRLKLEVVVPKYFRLLSASCQYEGGTYPIISVSITMTKWIKNGRNWSCCWNRWLCMIFKYTKPNKYCEFRRIGLPPIRQLRLPMGYFLTPIKSNSINLLLNIHQCCAGVGNQRRNVWNTTLWKQVTVEFAYLLSQVFSCQILSNEF